MPTARIASFFIALLLIASSRAVRAQTLAVSGNPGLLRINSAVAGSEPVGVSNSVTTYTITTPNPNRTYAMTMQLNANMPAGVALMATVEAPTGATSSGAIALDVTARNVLTAIPRRLNETRGITYSFTATAAAGVVPNSSRTVTLTIIQFP